MTRTRQPRELVLGRRSDEGADVVADGHALLRCGRLRSAPRGGIDVDVGRLLRTAAGVAALPVRASGSLLGQRQPLCDALVGVPDQHRGVALVGQHAFHLADKLQPFAAADEAFRGFLGPALARCASRHRQAAAQRGRSADGRGGPGAARSVAASAACTARRLLPPLPQSGNGKSVCCLGVGGCSSAGTRVGGVEGLDGVGSGGGSSNGRGMSFMTSLQTVADCEARRDSAESLVRLGARR